MSALTLTGEVCEIGDVLEGMPGFRLALPDGRVILVAGLTVEEVQQIGRSVFMEDATLTLAAKEPQ